MYTIREYGFRELFLVPGSDTYWMSHHKNESKSSAKPSKGKVFLNRLISTVILWGVILAPGFLQGHIAGDYIFLFLIMALSFLGLREFYHIARSKGISCFDRLGGAGGIILLGSTFFYLTGYWERAAGDSRANDFETAIVVLFVLCLCTRQLFARNHPAALVSISTTLFGFIYVPWLLNFIQKIYFFTGVSGIHYVFFFVLVTKFSDMGGYVVGSLIGRHKVIPRVSPGKTWEGLGGALLFSTGGSVLFYTLDKANLTGMDLRHAIALGVILSLAAVIGDLIESLIKREAGIKDSGRFFPGIGGMLDLLDSILFNAPIMYLYLRHVIM